MLYPQIGVQKEFSSGCLISLALVDMSYLQYPLTEGCPKEWSIRFLGGIINVLYFADIHNKDSSSEFHTQALTAVGSLLYACPLLGQQLKETSQSRRSSEDTE